MIEAGLFVLFLGLLFFLSITHTWYIFVPIILLSLPFLKIKRLLTLFLLLAVISFPYVFFHPGGVSPWHWLLIFDLRVLAMSFSSVAFFSLISPPRVFSFSRTLMAVFSLAYAQYSSFKKTYFSFQQALRSRIVNRHLGKAFFPYAGAVFDYFLRVSERRGEEIKQALRSRGFYVQG